MTLERLGDVLSRLQELPGSHGLFVKNDRSMKAETECLFAPLSDENFEADIFNISMANRLVYVLHSNQVYEVVSNARGQDPECTPEQLAKAVNHYYRYDGFMTLKK